MFLTKLLFWHRRLCKWESRRPDAPQRGPSARFPKLAAFTARFNGSKKAVSRPDATQ